MRDARPPCGSNAESGNCPTRVASARCSRSAANARASRSSAGGAAAIDPGPPWQIRHKAARHSATRATCDRHHTAESSCSFLQWIPSTLEKAHDLGSKWNKMQHTPKVSIAGGYRASCTQAYPFEHRWRPWYCIICQ